MYKIIFINPAAGLGGGELSLLDLLSSLGASMPDVERHLIATAEGPLLDRAAAIGVQARVVPLPKRAAALGDSNLRGKGKLATVATLAARGLPAAPATWAFTKKLRRIIRGIEPTLIHTNGLKAHLLARFAAPKKIPVVWHVRDFPGSRPVMAHALRWASRRATGAIAISNAVAQMLSRSRLVCPFAWFTTPSTSSDSRPASATGAPRHARRSSRRARRRDSGRSDRDLRSLEGTRYLSRRGGEA